MSKANKMSFVTGNTKPTSAFTFGSAPKPADRNHLFHPSQFEDPLKDPLKKDDVLYRSDRGSTNQPTPPLMGTVYKDDGTPADPKDLTLSGLGRVAEKQKKESETRRVMSIEMLSESDDDSSDDSSESSELFDSDDDVDDKLIAKRKAAKKAVKSTKAKVEAKKKVETKTEEVLAQPEVEDELVEAFYITMMMERGDPKFPELPKEEVEAMRREITGSKLLYRQAKKKAAVIARRKAARSENPVEDVHKKQVAFNLPPATQATRSKLPPPPPQPTKTSMMLSEQMSSLTLASKPPSTVTTFGGPAPPAPSGPGHFGHPGHPGHGHQTLIDNRGGFCINGNVSFGSTGAVQEFARVAGMAQQHAQQHAQQQPQETPKQKAERLEAERYGFTFN